MIDIHHRKVAESGAISGPCLAGLPAAKAGAEKPVSVQEEPVSVHFSLLRNWRRNRCQFIFPC